MGPVFFEPTQTIQYQEQINSERADGGHCNYYTPATVQHQPGLAKGTIVLPEQAQTYLVALNTQAMTEETEPAQEKQGSQSNESRVQAMLQLSNGLCVVRNTRFKVSDKAKTVMTAQSFVEQDKAQGYIYVDGGTNSGLMGRQFRMEFFTNRTAEMTAFTNDLTKKGVPIGSGLTKVTDPKTGMAYLLGMHESTYLEHNQGLLISTGQSREAGVWVLDVLRRHGGDQRIVAPIEGKSDYMMDMSLEAQDGLLALKCEYPTED